MSWIGLKIRSAIKIWYLNIFWEIESAFGVDSENDKKDVSNITCKNLKKNPPMVIVLDLKQRSENIGLVEYL